LDCGGVRGPIRATRLCSKIFTSASAFRGVGWSNASFFLRPCGSCRRSVPSRSSGRNASGIASGARRRFGHQRGSRSVPTGTRIARKSVAEARNANIGTSTGRRREWALLVPQEVVESFLALGVRRRPDRPLVPTSRYRLLSSRIASKPPAIASRPEPPAIGLLSRRNNPRPFHARNKRKARLPC
jgi:hypothetical protein